MANGTRVADLSDLLAAPVVALVDANTRAAVRSVRFIQEFGFRREIARPGAPPVGSTTPDDFGTVRSISFSFEGPAGAEAKRQTVRIPALSLVSIPLIQAGEAEFSFSVRLLELRRDPREDPISVTRGSPTDGPSPPKLITMLSAEPGPALGTMTVLLRAKQDDLPQGVSALLNLLNGQVTSSPQVSR